VKAVVCERYGTPDVLMLREVVRPAPRDNEVLIKIRAASVAAGDVRMRQGRRESLPFWPFSKLAIGIRRPRKPILGIELAGEIEAVGAAVTRFKPGDQVFACSGFSVGAYAEYVCLPEDRQIAIKPAGLSFEQAAAVPVGASTALFFLRDKARLQPGQKVLIIGASGSVGTYAVQLAKHLGAHVTGVCSGANIELVRGLGADAVIDYAREDFAAGGERYDVIFDTVGKSSFGRCKVALAPRGVYLPAVMDYPHLPQMAWTALRGGRQVRSGVSSEKADDLAFLGDLIEAGVIRPVIDRQYPLEQIAEAHRYVEQGHKKGNVVLTIAPAVSAAVAR